MTVRTDGDFETPRGAKLFVGFLFASILVASAAVTWWVSSATEFHYWRFVGGVFFATAFLLTTLIFAVVPAVAEGLAVRREDRRRTPHT